MPTYLRWFYLREAWPRCKLTWTACTACCRHFVPGAFSLTGTSRGQVVSRPARLTSGVCSPGLSKPGIHRGMSPSLSLSLFSWFVNYNRQNWRDPALLSLSFANAFNWKHCQVGFQALLAKKARDSWVRLTKKSYLSSHLYLLLLASGLVWVWYGNYVSIAALFTLYCMVINECLQCS